MQEGKLRLRTYRQVWQLEQVIYQIERVRLPFPVTFRQIGVFGAALLVMVVVSAVPPLPTVSPVLRYLVLPGLAAWYLTSQRLDGRLPHRWALALLQHWAAPKRLNRFQALPEHGKLRLSARVSYRRALPLDEAEG